MGKSWKKKNDRYLATDTPIDFKWSSQSYTLKEILANFKLPVVVQCRDDTNAEHVQNFFFDLRQPVVLHSKRSIRKIFARCVRKGPGGTFKELLPEVVVPEDYAGWFKISKGLTFEKPSPHKTIESLTRCNTEFFLCTTEFNAIALPERTDDEDQDVESFDRLIVEGEVLRKTGVQKLNQILLPEEQRSASNDSRYLMCIDEKDQELYIALTQTGLFYEVSDGNFSKTDNSVVQISDIIDEMVQLPLYVRHILGDPPPISQFYSPCLKLDRMKEEETVMGSTMDTGDDILPLEIQTQSPIKFEIALNTPMLQACMEYLQSVDMCNNVSENYVTDMKLAVNFKQLTDDEEDTQIYTNPAFVPDENEAPSSICHSQGTSTRESEIGDVEANSEFTIQWDPDMSNSNDNIRHPGNIIQNETDCVSIESFDPENAHKFNALGGKYVDLTELDKGDPLISRRYSFETSDVNGTLRVEKNGDSILRSNDGVEIVPFVDIVEGITDFSRHSVGSQSQPSESVTSISTVILRPPSPFKNDSTSLNRSFTISTGSSNHNSSVSSTGSLRSEIDLSDHFPSIRSSPNGSFHSDKGGNYHSLEVNTSKEYTYTGDVFINHEFDDEVIKEHTEVSSDIEHDWGNKFKVIKKKDLHRNRGRNPETGSIHRVGVMKTSSLSDDLMCFEETSKTPQANGMITCQVADDMVSSYNDLRLSLEEVTRSAHNNHFENTWKAFCLERSSSLPVRSKHSTDKKVVSNEDHSQSWEQISPRRNDDMSVVSGASPRGVTASNMPSKTLQKLNVDYEIQNNDRTQLILDTSSDDGSLYSQRSSNYDNSVNSSFNVSDYMDTSSVNGTQSRLANLDVLDMYPERVDIDGSVQNANTLAKDKVILAQRIKIKNEIKRKKIAEWGGDVFVI